MKFQLSMLAGLLLVAVPATRNFMGQAASPQNTGTIKGRVHLTGKLPGNAIIRMGSDPKCNQMNSGKRVIQAAVLADTNGNLANVFVRLEGKFPPTPVPSQPVTIDQSGCIYGPRVAGVRVGQVLQIRNSDPLLHNVHSISSHHNDFNVGQARAGVVFSYKPAQEEIMLKLGCDVHRWMTAYVGVVTHPYFAVSGAMGTFVIDKVPAGTYTVHGWHETYGTLTRTVTVRPGATATLDFAYTVAENSRGAAGQR